MRLQTIDVLHIIHAIRKRLSRRGAATEGEVFLGPREQQYYNNNNNYYYIYTHESLIPGRSVGRSVVYNNLPMISIFRPRGRHCRHSLVQRALRLPWS